MSSDLVVGIAIGVLGAWATMRAPHRPVKAKVEVAVKHIWPMFDHKPGEMHVGIEVVNLGPVRAQVIAAGLAIKGHGQMIGGDQMIWQGVLPVWVEPGGNFTYFIEAAAVHELAEHLGVPTSDFTPYARFADGREIKAKDNLKLS